MKLIIGYDGSDFVHAAMDDLQRAGLSANTTATIVSVAEVWPHLPASSFEAAADAARRNMPLAVRRAHELAESAMREARVLADAGAQRLRKLFPQWTVTAAVQPGSAADVLIDLSEKQSADLIVVGSCGKSGMSRLMLGSVSQKVLAHARCSVRIGRKRRTPPVGPPILLVGVDGSAIADAAVQAIAARNWPGETQVYIVASLDVRLSTAFIGSDPSASASSGGADAEREWINRIVETAAQKIRASGLLAMPLIKDGDARRILIEEAEARGCDCIFVGATGMSQLQRFLLGSVSTAVASNAPCSVEVVRPARG